MAPGGIEAAAAVIAGPAGLTLGNTDAAVASLAQAGRLAASGRFPFLGAQLRLLQVTMLVLPGHLAAKQASAAGKRVRPRARACTAWERSVRGPGPPAGWSRDGPASWRMSSRAAVAEGNR